VAYQYLQTLPRSAQGDANKMWMSRASFSKRSDRMAGRRRRRGRRRQVLAECARVRRRETQRAIDHLGRVRLPTDAGGRAAEAAHMRASPDDEPESQLARSVGLPGDAEDVAEIMRQAIQK